jgi:hypothetical protein
MKYRSCLYALTTLTSLLLMARVEANPCADTDKAGTWQIYSNNPVRQTAFRCKFVIQDGTSLDISQSFCIMLPQNQRLNIASAHFEVKPNCRVTGTITYDYLVPGSNTPLTNELNAQMNNTKNMVEGSFVNNDETVGTFSAVKR